MIQVFMVDDDKDYADSLKKLAVIKGVEIIHVLDLENMKKILPKISSAVSLIILDIKGKFTKEDELDDESFLADALSYLYKEFPLKPRAILTGDTEGYKHVEKFMKNEILFRKDNESEENLFSYIKKIHVNLPIYEITQQYKDVFEVFDSNLLPIVRREELIRIIQKKDSKISIDIKDSLGRIRDIQEEVFRQINIKHSGILPNEGVLNNRGEISVVIAVKFLDTHKHDIFPEYISKSTLTSYKIGCAYGIHTNETVTGEAIGINEIPSSYSVNNSLYSLFDLILWYKAL